MSNEEALRQAIHVHETEASPDVDAILRTAAKFQGFLNDPPTSPAAEMLVGFGWKNQPEMILTVTLESGRTHKFVAPRLCLRQIEQLHDLLGKPFRQDQIRSLLQDGPLPSPSP